MMRAVDERTHAYVLKLLADLVDYHLPKPKAGVHEGVAADVWNSAQQYVDRSRGYKKLESEIIRAAQARINPP